MTESPNDKSCVPNNKLGINPVSVLSLPSQGDTVRVRESDEAVLRSKTKSLDQKARPPSQSKDKTSHRTVVLPTPSMASTMSFADWRQASNESLMATAESLLDKLEGVAELLTEIDDKYITERTTENGEPDLVRASIISRFHEGVESARGVVGMLKREKWRLNKREMSVELRMGELEDYKSHLRNDMSSLNETVDALSMRVVQLENQLVEAQETQENLEADIQDYKNSQEKASVKILDLQSENDSLHKEVKVYRHHTNDTLMTENELLKNEVLILQDENHRLKELVRSAETHQEYHNATDGEYLSRLTNDFMRQLSSLEVENTIQSHCTNSNNNSSNNNNVIASSTDDNANADKHS